MQFKNTYYAVCTLTAMLLIWQPATAQIKTLAGKNISMAEMDDFLKKEMDSLHIPGLSIAIINKGKIVYNRALGTGNVALKTVLDTASIFEAASISKPVFAYFVMKQVDKGLLALDTPLYRYMPYADISKDERYKLITARMVLSHQTGFPNWRYFEKADSTLNIKYGELYLKFTPGTGFAYSGEGYFYLAKVLAYLNGKTIQTLDSVFQSQVAEPLKLKPFYFSGNTYVKMHKISGHKNGKAFEKKWPVSFPEQDSSWFGAAGGLHTNATTYARFLVAFMKNKGISQESMREMLTPQIYLPKDHQSYKEDKDFAWGLGIALKETPFGTLYEHGGNNGDFQSGFLMDKKSNWAFVFFTNCDKGKELNKKLQSLLLQSKKQ